jgi:hypothetical protein
MTPRVCISIVTMTKCARRLRPRFMNGDYSREFIGSTWRSCWTVPSRRLRQRDTRSCGRSPFSKRGCRPTEFKRALARTQRRSRDLLFSCGIEESGFLCEGGSLHAAMRMPDDRFTQSQPAKRNRANHELASSPGAPYGSGRSTTDPAAPMRADDVAYATLCAIGDGVSSRPEDIAALAADPGRRAARHGWRA